MSVGCGEGDVVGPEVGDSDGAFDGSVEVGQIDGLVLGAAVGFDVSTQIFAVIP